MDFIYVVMIGISALELVLQSVSKVSRYFSEQRAKIMLVSSLDGAILIYFVNCYTLYI